jgi:peroxiredoxin Q/BCP
MTPRRPAAGDMAPDFELPDHEGTPTRLTDFRGRHVIVYFYPKDDTPGCTTQACALRDHASELDARDAVVLGISPDSVRSHQKFREKYGLPFRLLADTDHAVAEAYGVWQEKSMYGRKYFGIDRTTFVIDEHGRISSVLEKVKPALHAEQILSTL